MVYTLKSCKQPWRKQACGFENSEIQSPTHCCFKLQCTLLLLTVIDCCASNYPASKLSSQQGDLLGSQFKKKLQMWTTTTPTNKQQPTTNKQQPTLPFFFKTNQALKATPPKARCCPWAAPSCAASLDHCSSAHPPEPPDPPVVATGPRGPPHLADLNLTIRYMYIYYILYYIIYICVFLCIIVYYCIFFYIVLYIQCIQ